MLRLSNSFEDAWSFPPCPYRSSIVFSSGTLGEIVIISPTRYEHASFLPHIKYGVNSGRNPVFSKALGSRFRGSHDQLGFFCNLRRSPKITCCRQFPSSSSASPDRWCNWPVAYPSGLSISAMVGSSLRRPCSENESTQQQQCYD